MEKEHYWREFSNIIIPRFLSPYNALKPREKSSIPELEMTHTGAVFFLFVHYNISCGGQWNYLDEKIHINNTILQFSWRKKSTENLNTPQN